MSQLTLLLYGNYLLYIVENNGYAMGTSVARTTSQEDLWKLGEP